MTAATVTSPLVSVIIPTFNRRNWIGECLDSVLGQTYEHIEIIVIDDCSTDGTVEWLRTQDRFRGVIVHQQESNGGASVARNTAIKMAKGDLIVFIDSDDMLRPNHIETAVRHFEKDPHLGLFCCDSTMIDSTGNTILGSKTWHQTLSENKNITIESGYRPLRDVFSYSNCFPGFTLRREVFEELGGFDQSIFPADDYDLALRVAGSHWKVYYRHEPLCLRREHDGQCSGIENSVKTQLKLSDALKNALAVNPGLKDFRSMVDRRLLDLEFEMGLSQIKEGSSGRGIATLSRNLAKNPRQLSKLWKIIARKFKRASEFIAQR
jgi:glycosyltransferase involved in cell wall biosynthesis